MNQYENYMINNNLKIKWFIILEMILFISGLVLQDFAVFTIGSSGIAYIVLICVYLDVRYSYYKNLFQKKSKLLISILVILAIKLIADKIRIGTPIASIIRIFMVIYVAYVSYYYIKMIHNKNINKIFYKILIFTILLLNLYGIYCVIGANFKLPWFLSEFCNNPSYGFRSMYDYYGGGWVAEPRIYATFAEPSYYAMFLCISIFIIYNIKMNIKMKIGLYGLTLINIYCTYSRSGYIILVYMLASLALYYILIKKDILKKFINKNYIYKIGLCISTILPFINMFIMLIAEMYIFNDLSSSARTNSSFYYLIKTFESISRFLFGFGHKANQINYNEKLFDYGVEFMAHNGYVQVAYEFGWIILIGGVSLLIFKLYKNISDKNRLLLLVTLISGLNCFVSIYYIESFVAIILVIIASSIFSGEKLFNELEDVE